MFKWFDRWFANKCKQAWENATTPDTGSEDYVSAGRQIGLQRAKVSRARESSDFGSEPITFRMFKANGGWAIEFRYYNESTDRSENSLYVVNNEEELGNHISKIITMEALKR